MGIGRQQGRAALAAIRGATNRQQAREQVADAASILNEWLAKFDVQTAAALKAFADDKPVQFRQFVDALPEPTVSQDP